jgi:hypothetical protein
VRNTSGISGAQDAKIVFGIGFKKHNFYYVNFLQSTKKKKKGKEHNVLALEKSVFSFQFDGNDLKIQWSSFQILYEVNHFI